MEEHIAYQFVADDSEKQIPSLKKGPLCDKIYSKHVEKYGEKGASKIREDIDKIFVDLVRQGNSEKPETPQKRNTLLVGKVQSGKTSNLEYLTALAFENDFNLLVIIGGYNNVLLSQTTERFRKTFEIASTPSTTGNKNTPVLFTSGANDNLPLESLNATLLKRFLENKTPVILCVLKNARRLKQVNAFLKQTIPDELKAFVIDDEGDQASLNIAKDKEKDASATYEAIKEMKQLLNNPLYLSVTASPHANIFLDDLSDLRPSTIHLLYPGDGYRGAEAYHLQDNSYIVAPLEDEASSFDTLTAMPNSLKEAIKHFLLASVIMKQRGIDDSDMIIHVDRHTEVHKKIHQWAESFVATLECMISEDYEARNLADMNAFFEETYEKFFDQEIQDKYPINTLAFLRSIKDVLQDTYCVLHNGQDDNATRETAGWYKHRIFIGADLLQRGLTFEHLVTTYFTRWAKSGGVMDTNLQRARWFGYRARYFDLCKMFTTNEIASEYVNLAYMEDDLWRQFVAIEEGDLDIEEIVILVANESKQKPTSRTKADFEKLILSSWIRQNYGVFDTAQIRNNNNAIEKFINSTVFEKTALARKDGNNDCLYAKVAPSEVKAMFESLDGLYDEEFDLNELEATLSKVQSVAIVQVGLGKERRRAFYEGDSYNKIKVLQQGRSSSDKDESAYPGDAAIVDRFADLTVQIHNIVPMHPNENGRAGESEFKQYMFAVYSPDRRSSGFIRR